jgi:two-component system, OmpR family, response regulator
MHKRTIAIVEDDPDQRQNYSDALRRRGFQVVAYGGRAEAMRAFAESPPDLAILDIMLGEEVDGGFDLCRELLATQPDLPVIFLTSRADDIDRISGLRLGAWDYQSKPVSLAFLAERVSSLFRILAIKQRAAEDASRLRVGALEIDEEAMRASWRGRPLPFTYTELNLLLEIVRRRGERGASYDALAHATRQGVVENNTINTHILHVRAKFRDIDPEFDCIRSVYGFGYRWCCT